MNRPKRLLIVGHMGAGKSLLGKSLAEKLGWQYVDANLGLERYIGRRLQDIIGKQGEEAFHQCEADILSHYLNQEHVVVTMDDGVITTETNRKLLMAEFVIYLKVDTAVQLERMSNGPAPLLPLADQRAFLEKLHEDRDSYFEEVATLILDSTTLEEDVSEVLAAIKE